MIEQSPRRLSSLAGSECRMMHEPSQPKSPDGLASMPAPVPVFNCVVYLATRGDGEVHARIANLAGLECDGPSERAALQSIVAAFKKRLAELLASEAPIPWIEPPLAAETSERVRLIGVHL
jgi:hypothetical protein